ncbi:hypothetical protein RSJ22_06705 [Clostridium botulinum]|uniref:Membrane protein n=1 Tax=Clostridium botulinum (strain Hall / ATCC 3502 / NCTC 13319 / Type A) TaxID=441771 RepID=A5I0Y3_CLOBH|nr:hypothetical protein [Clostridium botulinum]APQ71866.1 putative membrane protein [Clostridium botulinum]APQ95903.1 putative membrane protein [Clostridium botulinum]AUM87288.1 hypothetical protein RSJ15_06130 [Clostridium botulinum]AUN21138.1 hypothetical protein RSJ22_06705 [Clostridium botulinum]KEI75331.1 membrane protein [Clostridium botulinum B2 128]
MKRTHNILNIILSIIQIIFILPALILENLAKKKMGVIRYLIFKKEEFSSGIFNANNLIISIYILLFISIIIIIIFIVNMKKKLKCKINFFIIILLNIILFLLVSYESIFNLQAYHFFIIEIFIIIIIEYIKLFINIFSNR